MIFNLSDLQIGKVLSAISYVLYFVKEKIEGYNITERQQLRIVFFLI